MKDPNTLPNAIIAGVNKAGTSSLFEYMGQHPSVGKSKVKETCYFLPIRYGREPPPVSEYRDQFKHVSDKPVRFEATPGYFYGGRPLGEAIQELLGTEVRILILFRDPVQRLLSFFRMMKSTLQIPEDTSLDEYVQRCEALSADEVREQKNNRYFGIEGGRYEKYVDPWLELFGDRVLILFTEHLHERPRNVLEQVFSFVDVDPSFASEVDLTRENRSMNYKSAAMQRIAMALNNAGEQLWRRFPATKSVVRSAYHWLNGEPFERSYDPETIVYLERLYAPHCRLLRKRLAEHVNDDIPDWLQDFA